MVVERHSDALNSLEAAVGSCFDNVFVLSEQRDALRFDRFFDAAPGRQVLRAPAFKLGMPLPVITIAASLDSPGWILSRYVTPDSYSFVLQRPSSALARKLSAYRLVAPTFVPDTARGIRLGDPISKVTRIFGTGRPHTKCGLMMYSYAWLVRAGWNADGYVTYGADRSGRVEFINSGTGCCGKNHLWDPDR